MGRGKFEELAEGMQQVEAEGLEDRPGRQRAAGVGQPGKIPAGGHKLAFILFYLKVYPTYDVLSVLIPINRSEGCRWMRKLMALLEEPPGRKLMLSKRKIDSLGVSRQDVVSQVEPSDRW